MKAGLITNEQFSTAFDDATQYTPDGKCEVEEFRLDITKVACLMLEEGIDLTTFLHKSIMEYYAAAFIKHSPDDVACLFYERSRENYKQWEAVLSFLRDIDPYRYARDYTAKEFPPVIAEIEGIISSRNVPNLLSFINRHQPEYGIAFFNDVSKFRPGEALRLYGPSTPPIGVPFRGLDSLLMDTLMHIVPSSLTKDEAAGWISEGDKFVPFDDFEGQLHLTCAVLIRHFGADNFWIALGRFEQRLKDQLAEARQIIENQDRKKLIFQRPQQQRQV